MKLFRSVLFTPGNNMRMIYKAGLLGADALILDLEDAVPMQDKETARLFVRDAAGRLFSQGAEVWVRVNGLATGMTEEDLTWAVQPGVRGIVFPKAESRADLLRLADMLAALEKKQDIQERLSVIPILETAKGVASVAEVASADPRVIALALGGVDYCRDMGISMTREGMELLFVREQIALIARASDLIALDTPWIDVSDGDGFLVHAQSGRQLGFRGKLLIHPNQVKLANRVFSPSVEEVSYAEKVVAAFRAATALGQGAISLEGKMIDSANYQQAVDIVILADAISNKAGIGQGTG